MVLGSLVSIQIGAAVATFLFDEIGSNGVVFLRALFAAAMLVTLWRPSVRIPREQLRLVILFGIALSGISMASYASIARIPLGVAMTLQFTGPLTVALITSHRRGDLDWAGMAAAGVLLLTGRIESGALDPVGILLSLVAGAFWGAYILIGTRLGSSSSGGSLLALAMAVSAVLTLPAGLVSGGGDLLVPSVIAIGLAVGLLSAAIPFSLDFEAMRRLPASVFGVMVSLEPAVAAVVGFVILGQGVHVTELIAIALVVSASIGALRSGQGPLPEP